MPNSSVSTVFVSNIPGDMTPREWQNIFTFAPGFEGASLTTTKTYTKIGFAKFLDVESANKAIQTLQGYIVDLDTGAQFSATLANKDLLVRNNHVPTAAQMEGYNNHPNTSTSRVRERDQDEDDHKPEEQPTVATKQEYPPPTSPPAPSPAPTPTPTNTATTTTATTEPKRYKIPVPQVSHMPAAPPQKRTRYDEPEQDTAECSTIYIRGFPHNTPSTEIQDFLMKHDGYTNMRMPMGAGGQPLVFAKFGTPVQAREVVAALNGTPYGAGFLTVSIARHELQM
eukprot:TRINITY_DN67800_c9_g2_i1.p1 TRINITY_DN67800_c9_g2~~TRINITY_DN67800_c9_g2_i1.p1  ORF type:complete len:283 (+),score=24.68 TRINITY_DN67800_c9_g2_i1:47-895(+)